MMPSNGKRNVWKAASTRAGLAIQSIKSASRGKSPPNRANRHPIFDTSCLVLRWPSLVGYSNLAIGACDYLELRSLRSARAVVGRSPRPRFLRYGFNTHQLESQAAYAGKDAVELGLVDDLSCENRLPASCLHLHPFKGHSKSLA